MAERWKGRVSQPTDSVPALSRVSVIMPVLNEAEIIPGAIRRLVSLNPREVILVDGGSTDGTPAAAAEAGARVVSSPPGRALQQSIGADLAEGDILLFLHADTVLPLAAENQLARFADGRQLWGRFDVRLSGSARGLRIIEWFMNYRSRLTGIATGDQALFVRREAFDLAGGFSRIPLMEDVELSARLLRLSRPFCSRARVLTSSRRWEIQGVLRTVLLMWRLRLLYFLGVPAEKLVTQYR